MPKAIKHNGFAPAAGQNIGKRSKQKKLRCKRSAGPKPEVKHIIANSVFALTLSPIPGIVVEQKIVSAKTGKKPVGDNDYERMYGDLLAAFHTALKIPGQCSTFDPLKSGMSLSISINAIVNAFKSNIVPAGFELNIDKLPDESYCFVIWKDVPFNEFWHFFTIRPVIDYLVIKDTKLLNLFTDAIKALNDYAGISTWWQANLYAYDQLLHDDEMMLDFIECRTDGEELNLLQKKFNDTKETYANGEAKKYENIISKHSNSSIQSLKKNIAKYPTSNIIANWIREVIELVSCGQTLSNFSYEAGINDYSDEPYVKLEDMFTILWDEDLVFDISCEYLDAEVQSCGHEYPIINYWVHKKTKDIPYPSLNDGQGWIKKITALFNSYQDVLKQVEK